MQERKHQAVYEIGKYMKETVKQVALSKGDRHELFNVFFNRI
jgi:hypothetical protein